MRYFRRWEIGDCGFDLGLLMHYNKYIYNKYNILGIVEDKYSLLYIKKSNILLDNLSQQVIK